MKICKKGSALLAALLAIIFALSGCGGTGSDSGESDLKSLAGTYVFVGKDIQNPYMQKVYEGFETACREIGAKSLYKAPESPTAEKQIEIINKLTEEDAAGIAVAANDSSALSDALKAASEKGIKIISLDSAVDPELRKTHIQQADPEKIGRGLIQAAYDILGGSGGIGILSSTEHATNQNTWIEYMRREIGENPEKYASTPIVEIVYGDDDFTKSMAETEELLSNPDVKIIVSPTAVGMSAAGKVLTEKESEIKLTGLGMPSQTADYIENGVCPCMFLWNPADIGYVAGYTMDALIKNTITGAVGETFGVGALGERKITPDNSDGTEVIVGDLLKFDRTNILEWKNIY